VRDAVEEFWDCKKDGFCANESEGKVCDSHRSVGDEEGGLRSKVVMIWPPRATK
jgi:hypothetical protein